MRNYTIKWKHRGSGEVVVDEVHADKAVQTKNWLNLYIDGLLVRRYSMLDLESGSWEPIDGIHAHRREENLRHV